MRERKSAWSVGWFVLAIGAVLVAPSIASAVTSCGFSGGDPGRGDPIYQQFCVACHGGNGKGTVPGAPNFTQAGGGVLSKPHSTLTDHITNGFQEAGKPLPMPPQGGNLTDQDIDDVHAYLHKTFGCG